MRFVVAVCAGFGEGINTALYGDIVQAGRSVEDEPKRVDHPCVGVVGKEKRMMLSTISVDKDEHNAHNAMALAGYSLLLNLNAISRK